MTCASSSLTINYNGNVNDSALLPALQYDEIVNAYSITSNTIGDAVTFYHLNRRKL